MAVSKEKDKSTGGKIKKPGIDNPGYSKGDSQDKEAFKEKNNIWNNQTIDQKAPKVDEKEVKFGDVPFVGSDDAKSLSDIREKFAPNADKPTTASDTKSKKLPEITKGVDPQGLAQMLPSMLSSFGRSRDGMNITIPAARIQIVTDAFAGALIILANKLGYQQVINVMGVALGGDQIDAVLDPPYRPVVFNGIVDMIKAAVLYGPNNLPQPVYNKVTYGKFAPQPLVSAVDVPLLYVKQYYSVAVDPWPGYIEWISPDGKDKVYVKREPKDYPTDSAYEELYNDAEINLSNRMLPYVASNTLTAQIMNQILREQDQFTYTTGMNITIGNGSGGGGNAMQALGQLLGMLQPIVQKFKNGQLMEGVLDKEKNRKAMEKYEKNMGNLNKLEKETSKAFGLNNMGDLQNLQGKLGQFKGGGGGGGGGSGGGAQPPSGGDSSPPPSSNTSPFTPKELSSTSNLLKILANTNPESI